MCNDIKLKITFMTNTPSDNALKNFQKKLYQLQKSNELNKLIHPANDNKAVKPQ